MGLVHLLYLGYALFQLKVSCDFKSGTLPVTGGGDSSLIERRTSTELMDWEDTKVALRSLVSFCFWVPIKRLFTIRYDV